MASARCPQQPSHRCPLLIKECVSHMSPVSWAEWWWHWQLALAAHVSDGWSSEGVSCAKDAEAGGREVGWLRRRGSCPGSKPCPTLSGEQTTPGRRRQGAQNHVSSATHWSVYLRCLSGVTQPHGAKSECY